MQDDRENSRNRDEGVVKDNFDPDSSEEENRPNALLVYIQKLALHFKRDFDDPL